MWNQKTHSRRVQNEAICSLYEKKSVKVYLTHTRVAFETTFETSFFVFILLLLCAFKKCSLLKGERTKNRKKTKSSYLLDVR